ncbi:MAG: SDR family NAD(P)-dependent oxidoreductase [Candidatus Poribacteria bacterium]|nr:SDR family NAD(P)-dependent oxidoreductase [Candidatus Poribacteria bacterium]
MQSNQELGFFATDVSLEGKSAIVTGSSRGIGRAIAIELARQGTDVLVNYNRNREAAEEVQSEIESLGRKAAILQADVSDLAQHQRLLDAALDAFGQVDILVNNAGITRIADILQESEADFDTIINTNLKAPHFLTQRVANYMIRAGVRGCIIYTLSVSDTLASDNRAAYCISKAGLEMDMTVYAGRLAEEGIKVNGIEVGVTDTDLAHVRIPDYEEAAKKGYIFMFRPGQPQDIANAAIAAIKIYDTGRLIPAAGGTMTRLLNLRVMTELESNRSKGA